MLQKSAPSEQRCHVLVERLKIANQEDPSRDGRIDLAMPFAGSVVMVVENLRRRRAPSQVGRTGPKPEPLSDSGPDQRARLRR